VAPSGECKLSVDVSDRQDRQTDRQTDRRTSSLEAPLTMMGVGLIQ